MSIKEEVTQPEDEGAAGAETKLDGLKAQTSSVKQETSEARLKPKRITRKVVEMDVERTQSSPKIVKGTGQIVSKPKLTILPTIKLLVEKPKPEAKTPKTERKATAKSANKVAVEKPIMKTFVPQQVKATPKEKRKPSKAEAVSQAEKKTNVEILNMLKRRRARFRKAKSMSTITATTTTEGTTVLDTSEEHSKESAESTIEPIALSVGSKKGKEELKFRRCDSVRGICRSRTFAKVAVSKQCEGDLEDQVYYHGFRPRKDVAGLLKEPGDFLVRATDSRRKPEIVISVLSDKGRMFNLTVRNEDDKWQLGVLRKIGRDVPRFSKISELVNYYSVHRMPGRAKLRRGIPRPSWLIKHENVDFDRKDLIGTGNFCHVYKGTYMRTAEEKYVVAIKMSHEGHGSDKEFEETKTARDSMVAEAHMMSYYVHSHIVELYGVACDHPPVLIVMEFCPGGNLEQHLLTQKERIEVGERLIYALEACRGMVFLHNKSCVHRDLAARNCLISSKGQIKIADFGLSKLADELEKMDGAVNEPAPQIPLRWMAPESLRRPMKFSKKTDVWSFAVLMYEIFNQGEKPWKTEPAKKIATMIRRCQMPTFPKQAPEDIAKIATQIWVADPVARPAMKEVCRSLAHVCKKCKPPPPEKFTLNRLEGVERSRKVVGHASMEDSGDIDTEADTRSGDESLCTRTSRPVRRQRSDSRLVTSQR